MSDSQLLQRYAEHGVESALAALIERHLNLVYSVARRHLSASQLAEDVTQSVFIELARHARHIKSGTPLVAWLHVVARRTALNAARTEARRQERERAAVEIAGDDPLSLAAMRSHLPPWSGVEPLLDEAVDSLAEADRAAILLRYFENKSLRDVGAALGASEDAAQKRVSRALEQLRGFFLRRGIAVTAVTLATDLSSHALHSAPVGLGACIAAAAASNLPSGALSAATTVAMTTAQKFGVAAALVAAAVTVYEGTVLFGQRSALAAAQAKVAALTDHTEALRAAKKSTADRVALVQAQLAARALARAPGDAELEAQMHTWLAQLDRLRSFLAAQPRLSIPELQFLNEQSWFSIAAGAKLESDEDYRHASARLRNLAEGIFMSKVSAALSNYVRAHQDQLPPTPRELAPFFDPPIDPAILDRYQMMYHGKAADVPARERTRMITVKTPVDIEYDVYHWAGTGGHGNNGSVMGYNISTAQAAFRRHHPGEEPVVAVRLLPYLKWPVDAATLQKHLDRRNSGEPR